MVSLYLFDNMLSFHFLEAVLLFDYNLGQFGTLQQTLSRIGLQNLLHDCIRCCQLGLLNSAVCRYVSRLTVQILLLEAQPDIDQLLALGFHSPFVLFQRAFLVLNRNMPGLWIIG